MGKIHCFTDIGNAFIFSAGWCLESERPALWLGSCKALLLSSLKIFLLHLSSSLVCGRKRFGLLCCCGSVFDLLLTTDLDLDGQ